MRFALLSHPESWYCQDLIRAAETRHQITPFDFSNLAASLALGEENNSTIELAQGIEARDFDGVLVRTMPPGSLEQVIFRMDGLRQIEKNGTPVFNTARSLEAAVDKYLTLVRLQNYEDLNGCRLPVPPTVVCQDIETAVKAFESFGRNVVVKPLFGSEGRGLMHITEEELAWRTFKTLVRLGSVIYIQKYIAHPGYDYRVLVIGEETFGIKRTNPNDWRTNVSRGATAEPFMVKEKIHQMALMAAKAIGTTIAGIDFLPCPETSGSKSGSKNSPNNEDEELLILEVNAVPGWRALSQTLKLDVSKRVLRHLEFSL